MSADLLTAKVKEKAVELGFDLVGITSAEAVDSGHQEYMRRWLDAGCAGTMGYLGRNFEKRFDPGLLLENAQSVICLGLNYKPTGEKKLSSAVEKSFGIVANYALYDDYHVFMKERLFVLAEYVKESVDPEICKFKVCVDSVPLAERALAQRAGLGFIGKNHSLINPSLGSQIHLGEIITTVTLDTDKPCSGSCADCDRCIRACPSGALDFEGGFDARKCISYLTIEHSGEIPAESRRSIGNRLFGCDECTTACPYEIYSRSASNNNLRFYPQRQCIKLRQICDWDAGEFEEAFGNSTVMRTGLEKIKENARICLENIDD